MVFLFLFVGLGFGTIFILTEQQSVINWQEKNYELWLEHQTNEKNIKDYEP